MTIFKNANSEKKSTNTVIDVVGGEQTDAERPLGVAVEDGRVGRKWRAAVRILSVAGSTVVVLVLSLAIGMACGRLYRHYVLNQHDSCPDYTTTSCSVSVPFDQTKVPFLKAEPADTRMPLLNGEPGPVPNANLTTFRQDLEIDVESRRYVTIGVVYKDRRAAVFVHDFHANMSAIVDLKNDRCYVLPLNPCLIMAPGPLFNLVHRSLHGMDTFDLSTLAESYHAVLPPVSTAKVPSCAVLERCAGKPIYMLARCNPLTQRDPPNDFRFAEHAGNVMLVYGIGNYKLVERFESDYAP